MLYQYLKMKTILLKFLPFNFIVLPLGCFLFFSESSSENKLSIFIVKMQTQFGPFFPNLFDSSSWAIAQGRPPFAVVPSFANPFDPAQKENDVFLVPKEIPKDTADKKRKVLMSKMKSDTSALHSRKKQATYTEKPELSVLTDLTKKLKEKEKEVGEREVIIFHIILKS